MQGRRGAFDDGLRLRVAGPVGGGDQRGQCRQLDTGARVHRLDHPVAPPLRRSPGRRAVRSPTVRSGVQLAQHGVDQSTRGSSRIESPQGGADGLAPQPEPRAVVTEQPAVAVRGPGQPVVR